MDVKKKWVDLFGRFKCGKPLLFIDQMMWRIKHHRMKASSAELAYFTLLSLFPFFMILLNVFSRISVTHSNVISEVLSVFPSEVRPVIDSVIADLQMGFGSTVQLAITTVGAIYSASLGIKSMIMACNLAFDPNEQKKGISLMIAGFIFTVAFVGLIVLLFFTGILGDRIFAFVFNFFELPPVVTDVWYFLKNIITPIYIVLIIFLLNRYSITKPMRKRVGFLSVLPGAVVSTLLMILMSSVFSFRASGSAKYAITYGSISSVILLIVWLYMMGTSLILGFEINGTLYDIKWNPEGAKEKSVLRDIILKTQEKK